MTDAIRRVKDYFHNRNERSHVSLPLFVDITTADEKEIHDAINVMTKTFKGELFERSPDTLFDAVKACVRAIPINETIDHAYLTLAPVEGTDKLRVSARNTLPKDDGVTVVSFQMLFEPDLRSDLDKVIEQYNSEPIGQRYSDIDSIHIDSDDASSLFNYMSRKLSEQLNEQDLTQIENASFGLQRKGHEVPATLTNINLISRGVLRVEFPVEDDAHTLIVQTPAYKWFSENEALDLSPAVEINNYLESQGFDKKRHFISAEKSEVLRHIFKTYIDYTIHNQEGLADSENIEQRKDSYPRSFFNYRNDQGEISATALAFLFRHDSDGVDSTTLLTTTVDGEDYRLTVAGAVTLYKTPSSPVLSLNGYALAEDVLKPLTHVDREHLYSKMVTLNMTGGAWLEWVDSKGNPASDAFGAINERAELEIQKFVEMRTDTDQSPTMR